LSPLCTRFGKSLILHSDCSKTVQLLEKLPRKSYPVPNPEHTAELPASSRQQCMGTGRRTVSPQASHRATCLPRANRHLPLPSHLYPHLAGLWTGQDDRSDLHSSMRQKWPTNFPSASLLPSGAERSAPKPGTGGGGSGTSLAEWSCSSLCRCRGFCTKLYFPSPFQFAFPAVVTVGILNKLLGE